MRTWFKPFYSTFWHLQKDGFTLCGGWRIFSSTKHEERPDDAPDNCPACLRRIEKCLTCPDTSRARDCSKCPRTKQEQEGSVNGKD